MKKVEKINWFTEGFSILETDGFEKVTIESLCSRLGVTKGSFYHHFKNMDGYVNALMEYWLEVNTLALIEKTEKIKNVKNKRGVLNDLVSELPFKVEHTIRAWSYSNSVVNVAIQKVDKMRSDYLVLLGLQEGRTRKNAKDFAIVVYSMLIGMQQLYPTSYHKEMGRIMNTYTLKLE